MAKKESATKEGTMMELVAIVDASGSMFDIRSIPPAVIKAVNAFISSQRTLANVANFTLMFFGGHYHYKYESEPVNTVPLISRDDYHAHGATSLWSSIEAELDRLNVINPKRALICVMTDGDDGEYGATPPAHIKKKIQAALDRGWAFVVMAANMDARELAARMGVGGDCAFEFNATGTGVEDAFAAATEMTFKYRKSA